MKKIEMKIISGKHKCGKDLDMRIVDVKDDDKNIVSWIIYWSISKIYNYFYGLVYP